MKRQVFVLVLASAFLGSTGFAQQQPSPPVNPPNGTLQLIGVLGGLQQQQQQPAPPQPGQRGVRGGGGGRGTPTPLGVAIPPGTNGQTNPDLVGEIKLILAPVDSLNPSGAWWTNTALMTRLGLTDDQKLRIERVFESHRQNLTTTKEALEKEEAQLAKLLDAETLDRGSATAQIYKVVQARSEMEKVNSLMTLEMREVLTRAQWTQLQAQQPGNIGLRAVRNPGLRGGGPGGLNIGGARGGGLGPGGQQ